MSISETAELLGNFGDFFGSIAVLATLIYLAVQVRQAKRQLTVAGMQARATHANAVLEPIVASPDLAPIMAKLDFVDYGEFGLDKEESISFGAWCHTWMQTEQGSYYLLPKDTAQDELRSWWLSTPPGAEFWDKNKGFYDREFADYMGRLNQKLKAGSRSSSDILAGVGKDDE